MNCCQDLPIRAGIAHLNSSNTSPVFDSILTIQYLFTESLAPGFPLKSFCFIVLTP